MTNERAWLRETERKGSGMTQVLGMHYWGGNETEGP